MCLCGTISMDKLLLTLRKSQDSARPPLTESILVASNPRRHNRHNLSSPVFPVEPQERIRIKGNLHVGALLKQVAVPQQIRYLIQSINKQ